MNKNENGRSALEILSILAIAAFLTLGAVAGFSKAIKRYKAGKIIDQVSVLSDNIRNFYAQKISYEEATTAAVMENAGLRPQDLKVDGAKNMLKNPFGGKVLVTSGQIGYGISGIKNDKKAFLIKYTGLPREACVTLASYDWNSQVSSGLMGLQIIGKTTEEPKEGSEEIEDIIGPDGIEFQDNGIACTGVSASAGNAVACIGGINGVPLTPAQAGTACNCSAKKGCSIVWKYY